MCLQHSTYHKTQLTASLKQIVYLVCGNGIKFLRIQRVRLFCKQPLTFTTSLRRLSHFFLLPGSVFTLNFTPPPPPLNRSSQLFNSLCSNADPGILDNHK